MYLLDKGIKKPLLVINFKNYAVAQGDKALDLALAAQRVAARKKVQIAVAPPIPTLFYVAKNVEIPVLAQHSDIAFSEASTGHLPIFSLKPNRVKGSIINHSERRLNKEQIEESTKMLKREKLVSLVCVRDSKEAEEVASFAPDIIAVEPPELIGSGKAVSKVSPSLVSDTVRAVKRIDDRITVLCGAGISSKEDVQASIALGAEGVLVASAILLSKNQESSIEDMADRLS
ncbi:MAG: triose-phosphate isomerase [Conexivisphaerales archaeon]